MSDEQASGSGSGTGAGTSAAQGLSEAASGPHLNALETSASAYLRSARHQPVDWNEWGQAAFDRAVAEDKPILLDIGAVWCHWCHVMDRESYEDAATAWIINEHFVAVKVDRDERPDVDTRYQAAVSSISGQGGWPLTAFLTPEGKPYFGGTYFPPVDGHGRPSFRRVLLTMAEAFEKRRVEVNETAGSVMQAIEHNETFMGRGGALDGRAGEALAGKLVGSALRQFDARNGGFGSQPKFPHPAALDLLLDTAARGGDEAERAKTAALVTLERMAKGGIYDHLAGGFHRYSVDERWVVPHFEKMAYDNCELLKNYVHAYQSFGDPECARVARETMRWMEEWLSDRERGGFYASQDADYSLEDDGDYFTWTKAETEAALSAEEMAVAGPFFDIGEIGDMHHDPAKNVLHVEGSIEAAARSAGVTVARAGELLEASRKKLYAARKLRPTPYVDKTVYTGWNGMCVSAFLEAGRVLKMPEAVAFALKSLDRVLDAAWSAMDGMAHVVAYGEAGGSGARGAGGLEDYAFVGMAALDAFEACGEMRYFTVAQEIGDVALARFYDETGCAFFDTESAAPGEKRLGALGTRRKPLQDSPTPAGNSVAAALLLRLEALTGRAEYLTRAQDTLETFAGVVEHFGLYAASFGLALRRLVSGPVQVCVVGNDGLAAELEGAALGRYAANKSVLRLRRLQVDELPPALAETLPHVAGEGSFALICRGNTCLPPVRDVAELTRLMSSAV